MAFNNTESFALSKFTEAFNNCTFSAVSITCPFIVELLCAVALFIANPKNNTNKSLNELKEK
jgi:hypothetical protein